MENKKGRPRDINVEKAILKAAYDLLLEDGFKSITVEKIAARAKVSKATIYKWWPNKAAVVMESFFSVAMVASPGYDTGSAVTDITVQATTLAEFLASAQGRIITELIGEGQFDLRLAEEYRARYFAPRRQVSHQILAEGVKSGELKASLDIELCIDMIYGPIFYRLLVTGEKIDANYIKTLVAAVFEAQR